MPNKITVQIEALDYEITVRDIEEALKRVYPNMPTVVKQVASQPTLAPDRARYCHACKSLLEEHSVYCDNCGTDTPSS